MSAPVVYLRVFCREVGVAEILSDAYRVQRPFQYARACRRKRARGNREPELRLETTEVLFELFLFGDFFGDKFLVFALFVFCLRKQGRLVGFGGYNALLLVVEVRLEARQLFALGLGALLAVLEVVAQGAEVLYFVLQFSAQAPDGDRLVKKVGQRAAAKQRGDQILPVHVFQLPQCRRDRDLRVAYLFFGGAYFAGQAPYLFVFDRNLARGERHVFLEFLYLQVERPDGGLERLFLRGGQVEIFLQFGYLVF